MFHRTRPKTLFQEMLDRGHPQADHDDVAVDVLPYRKTTPVEPLPAPLTTGPFTGRRLSAFEAELMQAWHAP